MRRWRWLCWVILVAVSPALLVPFQAGAAVGVPAPGQSKTIDQIKKRGVLRAAAIGEFPWLPENTTGTGPRYSGPAWMLANEYANRLGVKLETVPVSHDTKVTILTTGQADISIAPLAVTEARKKVVDFVVYTQVAECYVGMAKNPKLANVKTPADLKDRDDLTVAFYAGQPHETYLPKAYPKLKTRAVTGSGANAPIEEITSGRADLTVIDAVVYPSLNKSVPGLKFIPEGDACLQSTEMASPLGIAVPKDDPVFHNWAQAVADEIHPQLAALELKILKDAAK